MAAHGDDVIFVAHEPAQTGRGPDALTPWLPRDDDSSGAGRDLPVRWIPRRRGGATLRRRLKIDAWILARRVHSTLDDSASRADLLHLHSNGLIIEAAADWARRRRVPYLLTLYGTEIWHYRKRWPVDRFTRAYRGAERVTFYSQRLMERAKIEGLDRSGLSVVYPVVGDTFAPRDETTRQEWRRALGITDRFVVLNVKRLHELAGQRFLIDAFARLCQRRRDVRLLICGDGPLREDLAARAAAAGVADRMTMTGVVPNTVIARYAAIADVFALPSLLEALPTVAVEALASGTPVISADHPGGVELHDLFGEDVALVPRESVEPLADALGAFFDRPRRTLPATADTLAAHFRPTAVFSAYQSLYSSLARTTS